MLGKRRRTIFTASGWTKNKRTYGGTGSTISSRSTPTRSSLRTRVSKRSRSSFKSRRSFGSIRRSRGRRNTGKGSRLTIAKIIRALTPLNKCKYSTAGQAVVGQGSAAHLGCVYYFPNRRGVTSSATAAGLGDIGVGTLITNGSSTTQVWPHVKDLQDVAYRVADVDESGSIINPGFFTPSVEFYVSNYKAETKFVNQSNAQAIVWVFTAELRRDLGTNQDNLYILMSQGLFEHTNDLDAAGYNVGSDPNNNNYMRDSSITPFDSGKFCSYIKIIKSQRLVLNAGDIRSTFHYKRAQTKVKPAMYLDLQNQTQTWNLATAKYAAKKGAVFQFFKICGQPANGPTAGGVQVNQTMPKIDFTHIYSFTYRHIMDTGAVTTRFPATGLGGGSALQIMGEQTDTAIPFTNA